MQYQTPQIPQQGIVYSHSSYKAGPPKPQQISVGQPAAFIQNMPLQHSTKPNQQVISSQKTTPIKIVSGQQPQQQQIRYSNQQQAVLSNAQSPRNHSQTIAHQRSPNHRKSNLGKSGLRMSKTPGKYPPTVGNIIQQGGIIASVKQVGTPSQKVGIMYNSKPQQQQQIQGFQQAAKISTGKEIHSSNSPKKQAHLTIDNSNRQRIGSVANQQQNAVQGTQQVPVHSNYQPSQSSYAPNTNLKKSGSAKGNKQLTSQQLYVEKKKHRRIISQSNLAETDRDYQALNRAQTKPENSNLQEPEFLKIAKKVDTNLSGSNTGRNRDKQKIERGTKDINIDQDSKQQLFSFSSYNNSPVKIESSSQQNEKKIISQQYTEQEKHSAQQLGSYNPINLNKIEFSVNKNDTGATVIKIGNIINSNNVKSKSIPKKTKSDEESDDNYNNNNFKKQVYEKEKYSKKLQNPMERQKSYANFKYSNDTVLDSYEREQIRQSKLQLQEEYKQANQNYSKIKLTNYVKPTISNDNGYKFQGENSNLKQNKVSSKVKTENSGNVTSTNINTNESKQQYNKQQYSTKIQEVTSHLRSGSSYRFQGDSTTTSQQQKETQQQQEKKEENKPKIPITSNLKQNPQVINDSSYKFTGDLTPAEKRQEETVQFQRQAVSLQTKKEDEKKEVPKEYQKRSQKHTSTNNQSKKAEVKIVKPSTPFINFNSYQPAGDFENQQNTVHEQTPISKFEVNDKEKVIREKNATIAEGAFELKGTLQQYSREVRSQEASPKISTSGENTKGNSPEGQGKIADYKPELNKAKTFQDEIYHKTPKNAFLKQQNTQPIVGSNQPEKKELTGTTNYKLGQMYNFTSYTYGQPTSYNMQHITKNVNSQGIGGTDVSTPQNNSSNKTDLQNIKRSQTFTQQMLQFNNSSNKTNNKYQSPQPNSPMNLHANTPRYDDQQQQQQQYQPAKNNEKLYSSKKVSYDKSSLSPSQQDYHNKSTNSSGHKSKPSQFSYKNVSMNNEESHIKRVATLPSDEKHTYEKQEEKEKEKKDQEKDKKPFNNKTFNDFNTNEQEKKKELKVIYKIGHNYTSSIDKHLELNRKKEASAAKIPMSKIDKIDEATKIVLKSSGKSTNKQQYSDQDSETSQQEILDIANKYAEYTPSAQVQQTGGFHTAKNPSSNLKTSNKGTSFTTASNQVQQHYAPINLNNPTHLKQYHNKQYSSPFQKVQMPKVHQNNFSNNLSGAKPHSYQQMSAQTLDERSPLGKQSSNGWNLNKFWILKSLGKGIFGKAYLAIEKETHYVMALKVMDKKKIEQMNLVDQTTKEIKIHQFLEHPNIVQCYGYFDTSSQVILSLEFCDGGNLYELLYKQPNRQFTEPQAAHFMAQIIGSVKYLHGLGIIHRDIKPENILVCRGDTVKLSDFGIASINDGRRKTFCGTLEYVSPEIIDRQVYDINVDVWALGVLAYELCNGDPPFMGENQKAIITNVNFVMPQHFSRDLQDFVFRFLKKDPSQRMTLDEALRHQWIQKNAKIYEQNFGKDINQQKLKQGYDLVYK